MGVVHTVVHNAPRNQMGVEAMAVVVAPNLLRPPDVPDPHVILAFTQNSVTFFVAMLALHIQEHPTPPHVASTEAAPEAERDPVFFSACI